MCLIIHAESQYTISPELMADFAKRNDDGFGVMWIEDNKIHAKKFGPTEMDKLYPTYESLKDKDHFIHLRMRTHGDVNAEMAHPYYCGYGIWLMHNGVLPTTGQDKSKSDTWYFINNVINPLFKLARNPHELIRSQAFANIMNHYLSTGNRIVMGDRGGFLVFNPQAWHRIDNDATGVKGMLVSNTYAWSGWSYGRPTNYTYQNKTYSVPFGKENVDETTRTSSTTSGEPFNAQTERLIQAIFFPLRGPWYVNREGRVYKRTKWGFTPRPDLDNSPQFWNQIPTEVTLKAATWAADDEPDEQPVTQELITQTARTMLTTKDAGPNYEKDNKENTHVVSPSPKSFPVTTQLTHYKH